MAKIIISNGRRGKILANLISATCPDSKIYTLANSGGIEVIAIEGVCLTVTRNMVREAYFEEPDMESWVNILFHHIAMNKEGVTICQTSGKIVIADSDDEKTMLLRMKLYHQMAISLYSEKLGLSKTEFVLKAIEYYSGFLETAKNTDKDKEELL